MLTTDKTDGASPLTVNFSSAGSLDEDPGDSIRYEWNFGDGSPISTEPNPTHIYTQRGRFTAVLTVFDSSGEKTSTSTIITAGNTSPTVTVTAPLDGGAVLLRRRAGVQGHGHRSGGPVDQLQRHPGVVRPRPRHARPRAAERAPAAAASCRPTPTTSSHGGNVFGVISAVYTDKGAAGGVPPLTTTGQIQIRQKHQEVEFVVNQSGTTTATNTDGGGRRAPQQPRQRRLDPAERSVQPVPDRLGDGPLRGQRRRGRTRRLAAGGDRGAHGLAHRSDRDDAEPDVDGQHRRPGTASRSRSPLAGKNELFLVFRSVTGGATGSNMFLLNWVEFGGNGVTVVKTTAPRRRRRHGAGDAGADARHAGGVRRVHPGRGADYTPRMTANVISTAGDATLSVADPSTNATGRLVNGAFSLPTPLQAKAASAGGTGGAFAPVGGSASPTTLLTYAAPVSNDAVTVSFQQAIGANDALRTGAYSKTLTFTLSTTTP